MKLHRLLTQALTSTSTQPHHRLLHPQSHLQFSLYSTTRQAKKQPTKLKLPNPTPLPPSPPSPPPPPPPPRPTQSDPSLPHDYLRASDLLDKVDEARAASVWKRPSEIPFQAKVANSVNLIGYVAGPVRLFWPCDGEALAQTILMQERSGAAGSLWIPIVFEGDLAHVAACHLKEKDFVHVAGQLTGNPPQLTMEQTSIQVMVHNLNFVQQSLAAKKETQTSYKQEEKIATFSFESDSVTTGKLWIDLLTNPSVWWDNRSSKNDPIAADFRRKDSLERLWIDSSTPEWIISKLDSLNFINKQVRKIQNEKSVIGAEDPESSWKHLVDNPNQWWDNRMKKQSGQINSKSPDFKHKDSNLALWLNRAPGWVLPKLEDAKLKGTVKRSPQKENKDEFWKSVVENPEKWWDNRFTKTNPKAPDFKHKETGEVLWLSSSPAWVLPKLPCEKPKPAWVLPKLPCEKPKDVVVGKRETLLS